VQDAGNVEDVVCSMLRGAMTEQSAVDGDGITSPNEVAQAAADDVARLLDRRGLRDIVALARRVEHESTRPLDPSEEPRPSELLPHLGTLRHHERPTRRGAAGRAVADDRT
jgi:hypothetical protein